MGQRHDPWDDPRDERCRDMPFNLRGPELLVLVLIILLLFGAKRLPDVARGMGRSLRVFKAETKDLHAEGEDGPEAVAAADAPAAVDAPTAVDAPATVDAPTSVPPKRTES